MAAAVTFMVLFVGAITALLVRRTWDAAVTSAAQVETSRARLRELERPRPTRAAIILDRVTLEGDWEVPATPHVLPPRDARPEHMLALRMRWSPSRDAVATQLLAPGQSAAVVYDDDRDLWWAPEGAVDLAFRAEGTELLEVGSVYAHRPEAHVRGGLRIVSPLQSEFSWFIRRHRWPSGEEVFETQIRFPTGWAHELVLSPDERRVCIVFLDQTEAGWIVADIADEGGATLHATLFRRGSNLVHTPAWSPDGRFVAAPVTADFDWWLPDRPPSHGALQGEALTAHYAALAAHRARGAAGGSVRAGWVWAQDLADDSTQAHEIHLDLPAGWGAELDENALPELGPLRFEGERRVIVMLPDGSTRTIEL